MKVIVFENKNHQMIPIGGQIQKNTMNESEAVKAIKVINPKIAIPTHYNLPV